MNLENEVIEMLDYLDDVNFNETGVPGQVSLFETTVRAIRTEWSESARD